MKRKFFSLMVAACAALFSVTGLTGCGGGGEDSADGVMTVDDFNRNQKKFIFSGGLVFEVVPSGVTQAPKKEEDVKNSLTIAKYCKFSIAPSDLPLVTYTVTPVPGQEGVLPAEQAPQTATIQFTFTNDATMRSGSLLQAFGTNSAEAVALSGAIVLELTYDRPGIGGTYTGTVAYVKNVSGKDLVNAEVTGSFIVY